MPEMDGAELGRKIKANPVFSKTQLLMMSSLARRGDRTQMSQIGFSAYLPKPVKKSVLFDCLAEMLTGKTSEIDEGPKELITRHTINEKRHSSARILLVEDNLTNQKVAEGILKLIGYRTDSAAFRTTRRANTRDVSRLYSALPLRSP